MFKIVILLLREDDGGIKMTISFEKTEEDRLSIPPSGTDNESPGKKKQTFFKLTLPKKIKLTIFFVNKSFLLDIPVLNSTFRCV